MPAGKSTEQLLAQRLDALTPPAGSSFNKGSAWEKLHSRLNEQKQGRSLFYTWWYAAAVVVIISCLYLVLPAKKEQAGTFTLARKISPVITTENNFNTQPAFQTGSPVAAANNNTNNKEQLTEKSHTILPDSSTAIIPAADITFRKEEIKKDTTAVVAINPAPASLKKKLPVVYNNEVVRTDNVETPPSSGGTPITMPGFKRNNTETSNKTESVDASPAGARNRWVPFNKSAKPKD
jgi:hypothetical protein